MNAKTSGVGGAIAVIVFALLFGLTIFGCMQGDDIPAEEEAPAAEPRQPGGSDVVLPGSQGNRNIVLGINIEAARIDCSGGAPRLSVRATGYLPLAAGTVFLTSPVTAGAAEGRYDNPLGELEPVQATITASKEEPNPFPLDQGPSPETVIVSTVEAVLPQWVYATEHEKFQVTLMAPDPASDMQIQSNTLVLDTSEARC